MNPGSFLWQGVGFALTTFLGTLLHFLYQWTGGCFLAAPFSGVNESTWEHMKLLFWPLFLFGLVTRWVFPREKAPWCITLAGILLGLFLIPGLFYTYNGAFGPSPDVVNIAIFYITAALVFLFQWHLGKGERLTGCRPGLALAGICFLGALFGIFTVYPLHLPLFQDPVTGGYGIGP